MRPPSAVASRKSPAFNFRASKTSLGIATWCFGPIRSAAIFPPSLIASTLWGVWLSLKDQK